MSIVQVDVEHNRHYFFAGGGTGGHIYPSLAVAEQVKRIDPDARIVFLCSGREVDARILANSPFEFVPLPALGFSKRPDRFFRFLMTQYQSYEFVKQLFKPVHSHARLLSTGGFVSAAPVLAAKKYKIPVFMLNIDAVAGKANRYLAKHAKEVFIQFKAAAQEFVGLDAVISPSGCPLREGFFMNPDPLRAVEELQLENDKKILLVNGGSTGALSVNRAMVKCAGFLSGLAERWQVVHLAGPGNAQLVAQSYRKAKINAVVHGEEDLENPAKDAGNADSSGSIHVKVLDYYHSMEHLLAAAHLVIGRAGAVSVAEYAAAAKPVILLPYPYHKDQHQKLNAEPLVASGAGVIVDDIPADPDITANVLCEALLEVMSEPARLEERANAARGIAKPDAARVVAERLKRG